MQRGQASLLQQQGQERPDENSTGQRNVRTRPHPHFAPADNMEAPGILNVHEEFTAGRLPKAPAASGGEAALGNGPGNCGWEVAEADGHIRREACVLREAQRKRQLDCRAQTQAVRPIVAPNVNQFARPCSAWS